MKTFTLVVCVFLVACFTGSAANVVITGQCQGNTGTPPQVQSDVFPGGTGSVLNTCPSLDNLLNAALGSLAANGYSLEGVSVNTYGSYDSGGLGQLNSYVETSTFASNAFGFSPSPAINTGAGGPGGPGNGFSQQSTNSPIQTNATTGLSIVNEGLSFNITAASALTAGTMSQSTEYKLVTYTYNTPGTPEPTALSIVGLGMIGLGILRRKVRKA